MPDLCWETASSTVPARVSHSRGRYPLRWLTRSSPGHGRPSITGLEFFSSARSAADRVRGIQDMRLLFGWVPVDNRTYDRA